jgi:hypothetical protein
MACQVCISIKKDGNILATSGVLSIKGAGDDGME